MKKLIDAQYFNLPKPVYRLFLIRLILAMGNFIYPFLVLLLSQKLKLSEKEIGDFILLLSVTFVPASLIGGKICDIIGRKKVIVIANIIGASILFYCVFIGFSLKVAYLLILYVFFNGIAQPANTAMVADVTSPSQRKSAYSLLYIGNNIGFAIGVSTAGFLFKNHTQLMFIGNAVALIIATFVLVIGIKESMHTNTKNFTSIDDQFESKDINDKEKSVKENVFLVLVKRPILLSFIVIQIVYSFIYAQHNYTMSLYLGKLYENGARIFGYLMTTNGIVVITCTSIIISLTKKASTLQNTRLAALFFGVGFGMIFFLKSIFPFFISTILWTFGEILLTTNAIVFVTENTPISHRGRINSLYMIISGTGFAVGPSVTGRFIERYGIINVWPVIFFLSIIAFILILILEIVKNKQKDFT